MTNNLFTRAITNIKRSKFRSTILVVMMTITFLTSGVLLTVMYSSNVVLNHLAQKPEVIGFFKEDTKETDIEDLRNRLLTKDYVADVKYVSKEQAMRSFLDSTKNNKDLQEGLSANIFPDHLNIKAKNLNDIGRIKSDLNENDKINDILSPDDSRDDVISTLKQIIFSAQVLGVSLLSVFTISTIFIILLTIGITVYTQKNEMVVLKLVGASTWYVRSPYLVQTIIYVVISICISSAILVPLMYLKFNEVAKQLLGSLTEVTLEPQMVMLGLGLQLAFGVVIALLSTYIATRRYIPV